MQKEDAEYEEEDAGSGAHPFWRYPPGDCLAKDGGDSGGQDECKSGSGENDQLTVRHFRGSGECESGELGFISHFSEKDETERFQKKLQHGMGVARAGRKGLTFWKKNSKSVAFV